jgi:hypothetical protein
MALPFHRMAYIDTKISYRKSIEGPMAFNFISPILCVDASR